jgi:antitoxin (DNA-binding transcriptional repressor) of toxin-antitoxin stability system
VIRNRLNVLFFLSLLPFSLFVPSCRASNLLLCGGAQVIEAEVTQVAGKPALREVWHWRPEESDGLPVPLMRKFVTTDDCKAVSQGSEILITSSGDAVALVSHTTGRTLFYATVKNAHSAELLPSGLIAVASSSDPAGNGDRLLLFDRHKSEEPLVSLPLEAAHGVVWDSKRDVLWALGGKELQRLHLDTSASTPHLVMERTVPLPAREGHDLQLAEDAGALYVTNTKTVFQVDPEHLTFKPFQPFTGLSGIKSLSIHPKSGQIAYTSADPGVWWTYTLRFLNPGEQIVLPDMIYKVRWF